MVNVIINDNGEITILDLYNEEPIKFNLSIEDITDAEARSVFSRTFRVPSTSNNNRFFKNAFMIEGQDFDVTVKKNALISVDGAIFKEGHIRLQKIYNNFEKDTIEYEIVFLGETRDFASSLGDIRLIDLDWTDLYHTLTKSEIVSSWNAYPQTEDVGALCNGDVLYPLVDFGNHYADDGSIIDNRIAYTDTSTSVTRGFNHDAYAILPKDFKPMVRLKSVIQHIFDYAGFEWESNFLDSNRVRHMYVSAWGNEPSNENIGGGLNLFKVNLTQTWPGGPGIVEFDQVASDAFSNWNPNTFKWVASTGVTGNWGFQSTGRFSGSTEQQQPGGFVRISLMHKRGATITELDWDEIYVPGNDDTNFGDYDLSGNIPIQIGDEVYVEITTGVDRSGVDAGATFFSTSFDDNVVPLANFFNDEVKCIDFVKDILKMFRLVMAPSATKAKTFIIEPWVDYIGSGETHHWNDKAVLNKDIQVEPTFYSQSARIQFENAKDEDFLNDFNVKQFKETFGTLKFDSNNELLTGTRNIKLDVIASTPMSQIEGAPDSNFILPIIHTHTTEQNQQQTAYVKHEPIKPVTRLLFYNGLVTQTGTFPQQGGSDSGWWFTADELTAPTKYYTYPRVSYFEDVIPTTNTLNLNWQIETGYIATQTGIDWMLGKSIYDVYWRQYINNIYNKYNRKVTAYFVLDNVDLQNFSFDDIIHFQNNYYRPEKVIDVEIGEKSETKVELVKLLNYSPVENPCEDAAPLRYDISVTGADPAGACNGSIVVTILDGAPGFSINVTNGSTYNQTVTSGVQSINFPNLCADDYTITITDACNQQAVENRTVLDGSPVHLLVPCSGESGSIYASYTELVPTGKSVNITGSDKCWFSLGLAQATATTTITQVFDNCNTCYTFYVVQECGIPGQQWIVGWDHSTTLSIGDAVKVTPNTDMVAGNCYEIVAVTTVPGVLDGVVTQTFDNCSFCAGTPYNVYILENCSTGQIQRGNWNGSPLYVGQAVKITNDGGVGCWEVLGTSVLTPTTTVIATYNDCLDCGSPSGPSGG